MVIKLVFEGYRPNKHPFTRPKTRYFSQKARERVCGAGAKGLYQIWWLGTKYQFEWRFVWGRKG